MRHGYFGKSFNYASPMKQLLKKKFRRGPSMVIQAFNSSTWEAEAGRSMGPSPVWSVVCFPDKPRLHSETCLKKQTKEKRLNRGRIYYAHSECQQCSLVAWLACFWASGEWMYGRGYDQGQQFPSQNWEVQRSKGGKKRLKNRYTPSLQPTS